MRGDDRLELPGFTFDECQFLVAGYLRAQGWTLIDARTLADRIWSDVGRLNLNGPEAANAVKTATWQHYAAVLYDCCRQADETRRELAWEELRQWLETRARAKIGNEAERQDVVQDTLIRLQALIARDGLQAPRALWALALKTLSNCSISRHRRQTAQKRGAGKVESLAPEGLRREGPGPRRPSLFEPPGDPPLRPLEDLVVNRLQRRQLDAFLAEHLSSDLQLAVARACFLDGLTPVEIAALLQKTPHEVRMVKSRAVRALRALPQVEKERLLSMLDIEDERGEHS